MTVTTRRERREKELRKRQLERRGGHAPSGGPGAGRGWLIGLGVLVLLVVGIFGLRSAGVLSTVAPTPTPSPLPTLSQLPPNDPARGTNDPDFGNAHVTPPKTVPYSQLPPTSGGHWPAPAGPIKAGAYTTRQPFEATLHNLEHGGIVIFYNNLAADEVTKLNDFVRSASAGPYKKVLDAPYPDLTRAKIVATSWRWHLDLQSVDTAALQKFVQAHYDSTDAPEPGAGW